MTNAEMFQDVFGRFPYLPCEDGYYIDARLQDRQWWEMPYRAVGYTSAKPKTKADRIRSMTDEEMADLLSGENIYPWCLKEPCQEECRECIFSSLKEEVKE